MASPSPPFVLLMMIVSLYVIMKYLTLLAIRWRRNGVIVIVLQNMMNVVFVMVIIQPVPMNVAYQMVITHPVPMNVAYQMAITHPVLTVLVYPMVIM